MVGAVRIIGAGQAGLQVAMTLRERGHTGQLMLVGDEPHLPYHRPPMSKSGVAEAVGIDELAIRSRDFIEHRDIHLRVNASVQRIDRDNRILHFADGTTEGYDQLVLATGSVPRRLQIPGADLPNLALLKDYADLERLRTLLVGVRRAVLIGGGFVGLELASTLTKAGIAATVLEAAPRLLERVASPDLSAFVERAHRAQGVDIRTGAIATAILGESRASGVLLQSGAEIAADIVLVGIGAEANDRLAAASGLRTDRGILVDDFGRTSDPTIYAAGDCVRFDHPIYGKAMRLESVSNAIDQARWVATNIVGQPVNIATVPWFWSDQFDLKIQLAGIPSPLDQIEAIPSEHGFIRHYTRDGLLRAVEAVNEPRAFMLARRRIERDLSTLYPQTGVQ